MPGRPTFVCSHVGILCTIHAIEAPWLQQGTNGLLFRRFLSGSVSLLDLRLDLHRFVMLAEAFSSLWVFVLRKKRLPQLTSKISKVRADHFSELFRGRYPSRDLICPICRRKVAGVGKLV